MSYNIDTWHTQRLDSFTIPLGALRSMDKVIDPSDGSVSFTSGEGSYITGRQFEDALKVTGLEAYGEGSGWLCRRVLEPAMAQSSGIMIAARIWEGGDSIDRLSSINGVVTTEKIDLSLIPSKESFDEWWKREGYYANDPDSTTDRVEFARNVAKTAWEAARK